MYPAPYGLRWNPKMEIHHFYCRVCNNRKKIGYYEGAFRCPVHGPLHNANVVEYTQTFDSLDKFVGGDKRYGKRKSE